MPKFVQEILENLDTDADIENLLWINVAFENLDFPDLSEDAFVPENILTL